MSRRDSKAAGDGRPWSVLGSSLWLRPLEPSDLQRCRAFLARRDLVRAGNTGATLGPASSGQHRLERPQGLTLVALDVLGAPAGIFHLKEQGDDIVLSFAVPRDDARVLREGLRLLTAGLPTRAGVKTLRIPGLSSETLAILRGCALEGAEEDGKAWLVPLSGHSPRSETPSSHAR